MLGTSISWSPNFGVESNVKRGISPRHRKTWKHRAKSRSIMSNVDYCTTSTTRYLVRSVGFICRDYGLVRRRAGSGKDDKNKSKTNRVLLYKSLICALLNATIREAVLHLTGWRHQGFYGRSIQRTRSSIAIPDVLARVHKVNKGGH